MSSNPVSPRSVGGIPSVEAVRSIPNPRSRSQGRYWMLTIPESGFQPVNLPDGVSYIKGQLEIGGTSGFRHWQLLVITSRKRSLPWVRSTFGEYHAELSRSEAADRYVWKEETRVEGTQFELGNRSVRRNAAQDWERVWSLAKSGELEVISADIRIQHYRTLRTIRSDYSKSVGMVRTCNVYWGPTETGKSRRAWSEAGVEAYPKDPRTKWWDGYQGQSHVVIDEFRGAIDITHMLRWLDRYPVLVEVKGACVPFEVKTIWITSNLDPKLWYPDADHETLMAFLRRLNVVEFVQEQ